MKLFLLFFLSSNFNFRSDRGFYKYIVHMVMISCQLTWRIHSMLIRNFGRTKLRRRKKKNIYKHNNNQLIFDGLWQNTKKKYSSVYLNIFRAYIRVRFNWYQLKRCKSKEKNILCYWRIHISKSIITKPIKNWVKYRNVDFWSDLKMRLL